MSWIEHITSSSVFCLWLLFDWHLVLHALCLRVWVVGWVHIGKLPSLAPAIHHAGRSTRRAISRRSTRATTLHWTSFHDRATSTMQSTWTFRVNSRSCNSINSRRECVKREWRIDRIYIAFGVMLRLFISNCTTWAIDAHERCSGVPQVLCCHLLAWLILCHIRVKFVCVKGFVFLCEPVKLCVSVLGY